MRTQIGILSIAGFFSLLAAAEAAGPFDGTYQVYASAKVNETYNNKGHIGFCQDRRPSPFTVVQGQAEYTTETGHKLRAPVGPNGAFEMRFIEPDGSIPMNTYGNIDGKGTVRVRQISNSCSYDFVWQRQP